LIAAIWIIALGAVGGGGVWWYQSFGPGAFTTVPAVVGKDSATASSLLTTAGLTIDSTEAFDHTIAADQIVSSEPEPGARIRKDGTVSIVISKGQDLVEVPDALVGMAQADAIAALKAAQLVPTFAAAQYSDTVAADTVISVDHESGARVERNSPVTLTLSQGPEPVSIPDVTLKSPEDAATTLEKSGLKSARADDAFSDTVPANQVISQSPVAGSAGHRTDTVTITVSKGQEMIEVPNLFGKPFDDASQTLKALGFDVKRENFQGGRLGLVWSQSVAGGTTAPRGSTITLTVA